MDLKDLGQISLRCSEEKGGLRLSQREVAYLGIEPRFSHEQCVRFNH